MQDGNDRIRCHVATLRSLRKCWLVEGSVTTERHEGMSRGSIKRTGIVLPESPWVRSLPFAGPRVGVSSLTASGLESSEPLRRRPRATPLGLGG